jgi:hypothetical protein
MIRQECCWVFAIEASLSPAATPSPSEVSISWELPPSTMWPGRHTCSRTWFSYHTSDNSRMSAFVCAINMFCSGIGVGNLCNISSSSKDDCVSFSAPRDPKSKGWRCAWGSATLWRRQIKGSDRVYAYDQSVERSRFAFWFHTCPCPSRTVSCDGHLCPVA